MKLLICSYRDPMNFRHHISSVLILCTALFGCSGEGHAEILRTPLIQLAQLGSLPPEQRREMRQQMREHWQQLPPEQRQEIREQRQERREAFQQLPQEDRSRMRDELRGRRDGWGGGGHGPQGDGRGRR